MKNKSKTKLKGTPSTIISFRYVFFALMITLILMVIIPKLLNYGPGTINTEFDIQMSYISYSTQFLILSCAIILAIIISTKILLKDIDKWYKSSESERKSDLKRIQKIRKKCLTLPYFFLVVEVIAPPAIAFFVLSVTGSHTMIMILKVTLLLLSLCSLLAVVSFIFSKSVYDEILSKTYIQGDDIGFKISIKRRIFLIILPVCLASMIFTALIGYSSSVIEKEDVLYEAYNRILEQSFNREKIYTEAEILNLINQIDLYNEKDIIFIMNENYEPTTLHGEEISKFVIEYMKQLVDNNNGRIYESYGVDTQGSSIKLKTENGYYYVGILYDIVSDVALQYLFVAIIFLTIVACTIINIFGSSLSESLNEIYDGFKNICDNSDKTTLLPVVSNDEIGNLVMAFNDIQKLNTAQIEDIHNKQNMLIERERLASLGQMVGGIAHSLKTPIFSISGGVEGLNDLINEFDSSIEDPNVNNQDMHEIAADMRVWIQKIKNQLSYMSEVITTVKGQAANLSGNDTVQFTISELFSHTNILMKHELQSALVTLKIQNNIDNSVVLNGNINSLVQVLNNLISNAIQSYNKEPHKTVELKAEIKENNIIISVKDYGPGLPESVKGKLFKEMVTTKGKEGTGLGVFMSYSMIKAKFNGDIKYESSDKGTEFKIYLPMSNV